MLPFPKRDSFQSETVGIDLMSFTIAFVWSDQLASVAVSANNRMGTRILWQLLLVALCVLASTVQASARLGDESVVGKHVNDLRYVYEGEAEEEEAGRKAAVDDKYELGEEPLEVPTDPWAKLRAEHMERTRARQLAEGTTRGSGWWSTQGNRIVDENGTPVFFSGINWDGFEYPDCVIDGIKVGLNRTLGGHLDQMKRIGFNVIRLPFAGTCIQPGVYPPVGSVDYDLNPALKGMTNFEILVYLVKEAGERGIRVILDYHRIAPPFAPQWAAEFGLWWNTTYPLSFWLDTWKFVVQEFVGDPTVVGVDLFNEPHDNRGHIGPYWLPYNRAYGYNWRTAARRAGNMILGINPNLLICVQGLWNGTWYGENLEDVRTMPMDLNVPNKLVYSVHDYGPLLQVQPWHHTEDYPANLIPFWDYYWGYIHDQSIAPIWVGEFGSLFNRTPNAFITPEQARLSDIAEWKWFTTFVEYIHNKSLVWTYFDWGPNAINVGGILDEDWSTLRYDKLAVLEPIMHPNFHFPAPVPPPPSPPPSPPLTPLGPVYFTTPPVGGGVLAPIGYGIDSPPYFAEEPPPDGTGADNNGASSIGAPYGKHHLLPSLLWIALCMASYLYFM